MIRDYSMQDFCEIHEQLVTADLLSQAKLEIAVRLNEKEFTLADFKHDFAEGKEPQICKYETGCTDNVLLIVLAKRPDLDVLLHLSPHYAGVIAQGRQSLPAALDDMAQIVGVTARVATDYTVGAVCGAMRGRSACLIRGHGMIAGGRSLNEAFIAALVLEKGARAWKLAEAIGGAKPVPKFAAELMHFVYQKKYSKANLEQEARKGTQ